MAGPAGRILIATRDLRKSFGAAAVLRGVDLEVAAGETVAILGPNGAGKSTLLKLVAGFMRASAGSLELFGVDCHPGRSTANVFAGIGYVGHEPLVYRDLSPRQNLTFFASMYRGARVREDLPAASDRAGGDAVAAAIERSGLGPVADRPTRTLSRGMLQRLALARATLHSPELLLLDEPFSALDPAGSADLQGLLAAARKAARATVLVAHDLAVVSKVATRVVVIARGRIVLDLAPAPSSDALTGAYRRATGLSPDVVDRP
jgi:ABC-type multidrug transport system ATPase subunit